MKKKYEFLDQINFPSDLKKLPELKLNLRAENIEPNIFYKITEIYETNKDQH